MESPHVHVLPRLPPELTDNIVDHLYDSPPDLCSCALVCKSWVPLCRLHLFRSISVYPTHRHTVFARCCRLLDAIKRSPCLALYVKELCFQYEVAFLLENTPTVDILELSRVLPEILRSLTRLSKLKIVNVVWEPLIPVLKVAFCEVLTLPSLVHFEVQDVLFPSMEHFTSLLPPQLKRLTIHYRNLPYSSIGSQMPQEVNGEQPCRLEYLELSGTYLIFVGWILDAPSIVDISNVRTFNATTYNGSLLYQTRMDRLMKRLRLSLEHLIIHLKTRPADGLLTRHNRHPLSLPNLKTLSLVIDVEPCTVVHLECLFSRLVLPNLQQIRLHLVQSHQGAMVWESWMVVDRILDDWGVPSLCSVEILAEIEPNWPRDKILALRRQFIYCFPLLTSRGILKVKIKECK